MNDDVKEEIGGSNGILIKEKLVNSHERYDPKVFEIIDLNHDGRLDDKGISIYNCNLKTLDKNNN